MGINKFCLCRATCLLFFQDVITYFKMLSPRWIDVKYFLVLKISILNFSWARISECMYVCVYVCPRTLGQRRKRNNWSTELKFGTRVPKVNTQGCFFHFFKFPFFSRVIPILPGFLAHLTSFNRNNWRQIFFLNAECKKKEIFKTEKYLTSIHLGDNILK